MQASILLFFLFLIGTGQRVFSKFCSNATGQSGTAGYALFLLETAVIACIFFFCFNGFQIKATIPTLLYALWYAVTVMTSLICTLKAYLYADVASVTVITSACGLFATAGIGIVLFRETIDWTNAIRIFAMLCAVILIFLDTGRKESCISPEKRHHRGIFLWIMGGLILSNCASLLILKYYSLAENVADENSMFFFTNVFVILAVLPWLIKHLARNRQQNSRFLPALHIKFLFSVSASTVFANLASVVGLHLIRVVALSVYTPLTSATGIVSGLAVSLLFREKVGKWSMLAVILALITVLI